MSLNICKKADGFTFECRVTPRASNTAIRGIRDGVLQVSLNSPPVDGRANATLIEFLSKFLKIPKSSVSIIRGERGRTKLVYVQGALPELVDFG